MQETTRQDKNGKIKKLYEFFKSTTDKGHTLVRRFKIGRNEICPCGSGKKFKHCCIDKLQVYKLKGGR